MQRRQFLKTLGRVSLFAAMPALSARRVLGANDRIHLGWIGCGGRGLTVAKGLRQAENVEFNAVCDVYEPFRLAARQWAGPDCQVFGDFRQLLEQKTVDAVLIATPDHWHAIPTILACQAGKDVYVEKPLAHNIKEGRAMVEVARRSGRIVQAGTQQRSAEHYQQIARLIQSGAIGPVHYVRIWNFSNLAPRGIGRQPDSPVPSGLDWDFYLGPAPAVPFNKSRFAGTFRWFWDYAGGTITDFGTHRFDSMHQVMGADSPKKISATGHRYLLDDGGDMPDLLQVTYEYPNFVVSYEACNLNAHGLGGRIPGRNYYQARGTEDRPHGEAFYGTRGTIFSDRIGFEVYPEATPSGPGRNRPQDGPAVERQVVSAEDATTRHARNFIEAIRSRRPPAASVEMCHRASSVAHLGNIAYRTGHTLHWNAEQERCEGDDLANALLGRQARKPWDII